MVELEKSPRHKGNGQRRLGAAGSLGRGVLSMLVEPEGCCGRGTLALWKWFFHHHTNTTCEKSSPFLCELCKCSLQPSPSQKNYMFRINGIWVSHVWVHRALQGHTHTPHTRPNSWACWVEGFPSADPRAQCSLCTDEETKAQRGRTGLSRPPLHPHTSVRPFRSLLGVQVHRAVRVLLPGVCPATASPSLWVGASPGTSGSSLAQSAALERRSPESCLYIWAAKEDGDQLLLFLPRVSSSHGLQIRALLVCQVASGPSWLLSSLTLTSSVGTLALQILVPLEHHPRPTVWLLPPYSVGSSKGRKKSKFYKPLLRARPSVGHLTYTFYFLLLFIVVKYI